MKSSRPVLPLYCLVISLFQMLPISADPPLPLSLRQHAPEIETFSGQIDFRTLFHSNRSSGVNQAAVQAQ